MRSLLRAIAMLGVTEDLPPGDRRFIIVVNACAFAGVVINLINLPSFLRYMPEAASFVLVMLSTAVGFGLVLLANGRWLFVAARVGIGVVLLFQSITSSLLGGLETQYHLFPVLAFVGAYFATPLRQQRWLVIPASIFAFTTMGLQVADIRLLELEPSLVRMIGVANVLALLIIAFVMCWFHYATVHDYEVELVREQRKSEDLLLNVLPAPVAVRLRASRQLIADRIDDATVLFADLVDFTAFSTRLSAFETVEILNRIFSDFDALTEKHGLEKIKTIGDAYMVAGGVPLARADHCAAVAEMALDMMALFEERYGHGPNALRLRIGIDSGPTVAGVLGTKKFIYDLWSDSVNTASRMESHGVPGRIQVTHRVQGLLAERYELERRGLIEVKGKGAMETWFLNGRRSG